MSAMPKIFTLSELKAAAEEEDRQLRARRDWGSWYLSAFTLELIHGPGMCAIGSAVAPLRTSLR